MAMDRSEDEPAPTSSEVTSSATSVLKRIARALGFTRDEADASPDVGAARPERDGERAPHPALEAEQIPWGYGRDRVTAMVVDPERLYVYWELTDEAIERARGDFGAAGRDAALTLRVYDVTGRIFDGTNAHSSFDHGVSRADRQWFFFIGRPSSTAVVELGLKSHDGFFVRVVRSGRADFPRREAVASGHVEWLTVSAASGEIHRTDRQPPASLFADIRDRHGGHAEPEPVRVWDIRRTHAGHDLEWIPVDESFGPRWTTFEWAGESRIEWEEGVVGTSWESGPFSYAVALPAYIEERFVGGTTVRSVDGKTHVVFGPWQVVIRGLGARAERMVLAVWHIHRSWVADASIVTEAMTATARLPGASEQSMRGASERRWLAGSEIRLRGASEIFMRGASELRYRGASETLYAGASEVRFRGASEWRFRGASETRYLGGSEQRMRGASEARFRGASERHYVGGSERLQLGASERCLAPTYPDAHEETAGAPSSRR